MDQCYLEPVLIHKGFRFRIYPTAEQEAQLAGWDGALRFLWNLALEQRLLDLGRCKCDRVWLTAIDQINELKELREEVEWLADVPRDVEAQLLIELDKAWQRCFDGLARQPRFKRKGRDLLNFCAPDPKSWWIDGRVLHFPKLGEMEIVVHRVPAGTPKTCTISRDGDQWFASIMCEVENSDPAPPTGPPVGIDRGVINLLADSDGRLVKNPAHLERAQKRLARAQRRVSRKRKGSKNRAKANLRVARIHRKVRRQRDNVLHTESLRYAKNHSVIVIESLKIGNMTRSAKGTIEEPGTNVAQKSGLNRRILGAGWGKFDVMLGYKTVWYGSELQEKWPAYSSMECSDCHCVDARNRNGEVFLCVSCGHREHADTNAAKVILSRRTDGGAVCGGHPTAGPKKQKLRVVRRGLRSKQGQGSSKAPAFRPE